MAKNWVYSKFKSKLEVLRIEQLIEQLNFTCKRIK